MCDDFLEAEPMTLSVLLRTRTVSRSMNWDWDMVASHFVTSDSVVDMSWIGTVCRQAEIVGWIVDWRCTNDN